MGTVQCQHFCKYFPADLMIHKFPENARRLGMVKVGFFTFSVELGQPSLFYLEKDDI